MAKGHYSFDGPVGSVSFDWDEDREPTPEELTQIYWQARGDTPPPPMKGDLAEKGRAGEYNPKGPGKDFSPLWEGAKALVTAPKKAVDIGATVLSELPRGYMMTHGYDKYGTSDLNLDEQGLTATPIEEQISRHPLLNRMNAMTMLAGPAGPLLGAIAPEGIQKPLEAIGKPITNTIVGAGTDPTTYIAFHKGPALIQKGAAIIFGGQAAVHGLVGLGTAAQQVRAGNYTDALGTLTDSGLSLGMAALMLGQLKSGNSVKDVLVDAAEGRGPFSGQPLETQFRNIGQQPYGLNDLAQEGAGPKGAIESSFGAMKPPGDFSFDELGKVGGMGPIEARMATSEQPAPLDWQTVGNPEALGKTIQESEAARNDRDQLRAGQERAPAPVEPGTGIEDEYGRVKEEGKKLALSGVKHDVRMKEPPFTFEELRGMDPDYQPGTENPIPDIRASEPLSIAQAPKPWKPNPEVNPDVRISHEARMDFMRDFEMGEPYGDIGEAEEFQRRRFARLTPDELELYAKVDATVKDASFAENDPKVGKALLVRWELERKMADTKHEFDDYTKNIELLKKSLKMGGRALPSVSDWNNETGALMLGGGGGKKATPPTPTKNQPTSNPRPPKKASIWDMLYEARRNMLLPGTVMGKKVASDVIQQGEHPILRAVASGIDNLQLRAAFERAVGAPATPAGVERPWSDVGEHVKALLDPRVGRAAIEAAKAGWEESAYAVNPHSSEQMIPGALGKGIRIPQRLISIPTNFAMEITRGTEQRVWAGREATARGLTGQAYDAEVDRLANLPLNSLPTTVREKILKTAAEKTLLAQSGFLAKKINAWRQAGFKWISPFFQVSSNMVKNVYQRTPAYLPELAYKTHKGELRGGELSDELAKPLLYVPIFMGLLAAAKRGLLTGSGPAQKAQQYNKQDTGWQPNSLHLGDKYISHLALGPTSHVLSLAADYVEAGNEKDQRRIAQKMYNSVSENFTPSTVQDIAGIMSLIHWDDQGFEKRVSRTVGTMLSGAFVPRVISKLATAEDTDASGEHLLSRKVDAPQDYIMRDIPGLREKLPLLRAPTGKPVTRDAPPFMSGMVNPFQVSHERPDATVERTFEKVDWLPRGTSKTQTLMTPVGQVKVDLTQEEQSKLLDANQRATEVAKRVVASQGFQHLPNGMKKVVLMNIYDKFRGGAEGALKPALYRRAMEMVRSGDLPQAQSEEEP